MNKITIENIKALMNKYDSLPEASKLSILNKSYCRYELDEITIREMGNTLNSFGFSNSQYITVDLYNNHTDLFDINIWMNNPYKSLDLLLDKGFEKDHQDTLKNNIEKWIDSSVLLLNPEQFIYLQNKYGNTKYSFVKFVDPKTPLTTEFIENNVEKLSNDFIMKSNIELNVETGKSLLTNRTDIRSVLMVLLKTHHDNIDDILEFALNSEDISNSLKMDYIENLSDEVIEILSKVVGKLKGNRQLAFYKILVANGIIPNKYIDELLNLIHKNDNKFIEIYTDKITTMLSLSMDLENRIAHWFTIRLWADGNGYSKLVHELTDLIGRM